MVSKTKMASFQNKFTFTVFSPWCILGVKLSSQDLGRKQPRQCVGRDSLRSLRVVAMKEFEPIETSRKVQEHHLRQTLAVGKDSGSFLCRGGRRQTFQTSNIQRPGRPLTHEPWFWSRSASKVSGRMAATWPYDPQTPNLNSNNLQRQNNKALGA